MKLYEIAESYNNVAELLANPEFAENADIITALDAIEDEFNNKAINTIKAIKRVEGDIDLLDAEIKRLTAMKKARQNRIEEVKNYLKYNMQKTGIFKIESPLFKIAYSERKQSAVEIDDNLFLANNLDENLVSVKITPNKTAIKEALKRGDDVIGARLVDSQVLSIK
ncbi:siphovirus Gp157 family protein [Avibacterium paragallinarum]|uniref:Siphovirus Gp157 n=1 Tax=Avibacterium paragallinarum TaxID=728 RepID=A0A0F5EWU2_AVIPA|nr:siphovirus Gp157 family protein [Avibacterium paragallinarum]AZI13592.1 siphovirus Gp157 family protein [Avibacterium paragallinarum]QIR12093.1 siphovirus Gp157 family protein [Avibacterium paragallinarum]QJE09087.1 siphovirus Gp157 family protein [Avibacterium paragallinarum]QJE11283.1 siphovirus Gp157 family protein [Avibacterium paragallinarum]QJE13480.1 siphovirus Gp157 family protein [Avibacterium paragallinarum]